MDKADERKTAIITGASRGIGKAAALEMAAAGVNIAAICASKLEPAAEVCEECEKRFLVKAKAYLCDVSNAEDVKKTVAAIREDFGAVQILVNNAGITRDGLVMTMKDEDFDAVIATNLKGAFLMTRQCLPLFLRAKEGSIVNISSVVGLIGNPGQANYAAAKAGIIGMTKAVAREYASKGIRANAVAPGYIKTNMTEGISEEELAKSIPLGHMGSPEDIARAVRFLAFEKYITGEVLKVDGGIGM